MVKSVLLPPLPLIFRQKNKKQVQHLVALGGGADDLISRIRPRLAPWGPLGEESEQIFNQRLDWFIHIIYIYIYLYIMCILIWYLYVDIV